MGLQEEARSWRPSGHLVTIDRAAHRSTFDVGETAVDMPRKTSDLLLRPTYALQPFSFSPGRMGTPHGRKDSISGTLAQFVNGWRGACFENVPLRVCDTVL